MQSSVSRDMVLRAKRKFAKKELARKRKESLSNARKLTTENLALRLRESASKKVRKIKGGGIIISHSGKKMFLSLNDGQNMLAKADISVHVHGLQLIAAIDQIQGVFGRKKELDLIKSANKKPWNILLVTMAVEAAKEAGFTKVLLRDITTSRFYRKPNVPFHSMMPSEVVVKWQLEKRAAMERLYKATARELGFKEKEGHYYSKLLI